MYPWNMRHHGSPTVLFYVVFLWPNSLVLLCLLTTIGSTKRGAYGFHLLKSTQNLIKDSANLLWRMGYEIGTFWRNSEVNTCFKKSIHFHTNNWKIPWIFPVFNRKSRLQSKNYPLQPWIILAKDIFPFATVTDSCKEVNFMGFSHESGILDIPC